MRTDTVLADRSLYSMSTSGKYWTMQRFVITQLVNSHIFPRSRRCPSPRFGSRSPRNHRHVLHTPRLLTPSDYLSIQRKLCKAIQQPRIIGLVTGSGHTTRHLLRFEVVLRDVFRLELVQLLVWVRVSEDVSTEVPRGVVCLVTCVNTSWNGW